MPKIPLSEVPPVPAEGGERYTEDGKTVIDVGLHRWRIATESGRILTYIEYLPTECRQPDRAPWGKVYEFHA